MYPESAGKDRNNKSLLCKIIISKIHLRWDMVEGGDQQELQMTPRLPAIHQSWTTWASNRDIVVVSIGGVAAVTNKVLRSTP